MPPPPPNCNATDPPAPYGVCANLVVNPGFERTLNGDCPRDINGFGAGRPAPGFNSAAANGTSSAQVGDPISSMVCGWFSGCGNGRLNTGGTVTPDLFNACAPGPNSGATSSYSVGVPCNFATAPNCAAGGTGSQPVRSGGQAYAGIIAYTRYHHAPAMYPPDNSDEYREYVAQNVSLQAGKAYYAHFWTNIAPAAAIALPRLDMAFTTLPARGSLPSAYPAGPIPLTPVVSGPVPTTPQPNWQRVQGLFTATGRETQMIIGYFGPGYSSGEPPYTAPFVAGPRAGFSFPAGSYPGSELANSAYYFIDDVVLQEMPTAGPDRRVDCGQQVVLGASCALPADAGATYSWSPTTNLLYGSEHSLHALLLGSPTTPTSYSLTVTLANGQTHTSTTHVTVNPVSIVPSREGPYCAGSTLTLTASGGGPYTWSSPGLPGFSASGPSITVNLSHNITYEVHGPCGGTGFDLPVRQNCCLLSEYMAQGRRIKDLSGLYDLNSGSPFNEPPGTIYHVVNSNGGAGGGISLEEIDFTIPPGSMVLLDGSAVIELRNDATLQMAGATLTAACDEMWWYLFAEANSGGISTSDPTNPTLRTTIEHSFYGVSFNNGGGSGGPVFQLSNVDFRQNRVGVTIHKTFGPSANSWIRNCTFDADSSTFKQPLEYRSNTDYSYSDYHVQITGDVRANAWTDNTFSHAMVGILLGEARSTLRPNYGLCKLEDNKFTNCYVAGVAQYEDINSGGYYTPADESEVYLARNRFTMPVSQPTTQQTSRMHALNTYTSQHSFGVLLPTTRVDAFDNDFEQPATYDPNRYDYDFDSQRPVPETGLLTNMLRKAERNTFTHLGRGLVTMLATDAAVDLEGNRFTDCAVGAQVGTRYAPLPWHDPNSVGQPVLFTSCNTFERDVLRRGTATGLLLAGREPGAKDLVLDNFYQYQRNYPLKDEFIPNGYGPADYVYIDNQSFGQVTYNTFNDQARDYPPFVDQNAVYFNAVGAINPLATPTSPSPRQKCELDGFSYTGVQYRGGSGAAPAGVSSRAHLEQNFPNPCTGSTVLAYVLPAAAQQARLVIRRGLDGVEMEQVALSAKVTQHTLDLRAYKPGLYFYTLLVDGVPVQTKRMLVE